MNNAFQPLLNVQPLLNAAKDDISQAAEQLANIDIYRKELEKTLEQHVKTFQHAMKHHDIAGMQPFLASLKSFESLKNVVRNVLPGYLINDYPLEVMQAVFPYLTTDKIKQWKSLQFMPTAENEINTFAKKSFEHNTDKLQWLLTEHPHVFENTYQEQVFRFWGNIYFDPVKHAQLNEYVLSHHPNVHHILDCASRYESEMEIDVLNYFSEKLSHIPINQDCEKLLESAIIGANSKAISFWIERGVTFEPTGALYSSLISQSGKKTGFWPTIEMLCQHYDLYDFNHQIFRSSLHHITDQGSLRWDNCVRILDMYDVEKIPQALDLIDKKIKKLEKEQRSVNLYVDMKATANALYLHKKLNKTLPEASIKSKMKI